MKDLENTDRSTRLDWRVVFGITLTAVWILAGLTYLLIMVGWVNFVSLPTGDIGSFLEGAFAPLAFLWLVIGHFMQQTEISANTKATQQQEESSKRQEIHSQRNSYFKLLSLVQEQLGNIAGFHYVSVCGETGTGEITGDDYQRMRAESANGDAALFIRKMVSLAGSHTGDMEAIREIFLGTDIRTRHSNNFATTFGKLLANARAIDHDDMVVNALLYGSPSGMLYRIIRAAQGKEKLNPLTGFATVQSQNQAE
ncbi:MAG: hypothetical protein HKN85_02465 [Gammaproteobacteria bacterium]|nr:hypothetical protein [Gammaproteobacteria bacterium]